MAFVFLPTIKAGRAARSGATLAWHFRFIGKVWSVRCRSPGWRRCCRGRSLKNILTRALSRVGLVRGPRGRVAALPRARKSRRRIAARGKPTRMMKFQFHHTGEDMSCDRKQSNFGRVAQAVCTTGFDSRVKTPAHGTSIGWRRELAKWFFLATIYCKVHPRSMACSQARAPNGDLSQIPRLTFAGHFRLYSGVPAQPAAARLLYLIE